MVIHLHQTFSHYESSLKLKNILTITFLTFIVHIPLKGQEVNRSNFHRVTISSSLITIHGETNINNFHCSLLRSFRNDSILVKNIWSNQKLDFEGFKLQYKIEDFKCGFRAMNNDFQELLRADDYPFITLQLNSITLHPENVEFEELDVDAEVNVMLAGITKDLIVADGKVINHTPAHLTLMGRKKLMISDFQIEPPTKFMGMVKVTDEIEIEFEISMNVVLLK